MTAPRHIAVIDLGKTNAKLALVDAATLSELAVVKRPNAVLPGPPYPHFDLEGHWDFFLHHLAAFHASHGIDAISVTTHGAAAVLLDGAGDLVLPMLDYEHDLSDTATAYEALRPDFARTGSPRLGMGLNLGAQLHHLKVTQPDAWSRLAHVVTYPQYWGYRLTGRFGTDVTSLGCHTDLWDPAAAAFSDLVETLGLTEKLAEPHRSSDILGGVTAGVAARTGLPKGTPVACGIHDSNASLYPHLLGRSGAFSVVSTGTWVVVMAMGAGATPLDPARDTLVNVNAMGDPVASARFMGGREYEIVRDGSDAAPTAADRAAVLEGLMLLPAVEPGSGPFPGRVGGWTAPPATEGARMLAPSWYLALMTDTCLSLAGASGPVIVEGPFAANPDYLEMLAALRPEGVETAASATGTSVGAALLMLPEAPPPATRAVIPGDSAALRDYAARWRRAVKAPMTDPQAARL
ncbi:FGGY-family carbohydrate kinase [Mangrovicoccus algicola]|uniref:FGGY-family carbohydrate kinase n=1 Tax=Mangrovicoccus algicola TaxID=2771008 RepID=A0A8J6Z5D8_9RHOB|nr:FGGY-family carbohydrate kinase [Mangrovicoccus algicola]MBE3636866.1 FGGY-family carbohydrate kinase [Mangrovicoccus algicola]